LAFFYPARCAAALAYTLGTLGLTNTVSGLILIHCVQGLAFTTLFLSQLLRQHPDALIKAARIGRCGLLAHLSQDSCCRCHRRS